MKSSQLPNSIDPYQWCSSPEPRELAGAVRLSMMDNLEGKVIFDDKAEAQVNLQCFKQGQTLVIEGTIKAYYQVLCQRCLGPMEVTMEPSIKYAVIGHDKQATTLGSDYEPLVVPRETLLDLPDLVSQEILLSLPIVATHDDLACSDELNNLKERVMQEEALEKPNPFSALLSLKG